MESTQPQERRRSLLSVISVKNHRNFSCGDIWCEKQDLNLHSLSTTRT